jgi:hypothetical protein
MTHAELANTITDRMIRKHEVRKMTTRIHDVRHENMVEICAALEVLTQLYQESPNYDACKSLDARAILWDLMSEYDVSNDEVSNHELCQIL